MDRCDIKLEEPLFYNMPYGLRFEIGPEALEIWTDFDKGDLNDQYFNAALERAIAIFETAFISSHTISIVYQIYSDGRRRIRQGSFLFKQIKDIQSRTLAFSKRRDLYPEELWGKRHCLQQVKISGIQVQDINHQNILRALVNQDFSLRRTPALQGHCFFLNHDKGLVLDLYDDRGMDIVALQKEPLELLYQTHHAWILDSDRAAINQIFAG